MRRFHSPDPYLIIATVVLVIFGVIMVSSASVVESYQATGSNTYYFFRQAIFAAIGLGLWFILQKVDYHQYRLVATLALFAGLLLLLLVFIPVVNAQSNFDIGAVSIEQLQEILSNQAIEVPESARSLVKSDERINLIITDTRELNVILKNYKAVSINEGKLEDSTVDIIATKNAVNTMSTTDDQKGSLTELINNGEIQVKPKGFFGKLKIGFAKLFLKFL